MGRWVGVFREIKTVSMETQRSEYVGLGHWVLVCITVVVFGDLAVAKNQSADIKEV